VGDKVVRVEVAAVGEDLIVRNQDETGGYTASSDAHEVRMGDATPSATEGQSAKRKAPSLRLPGEEELPGTMQPVSSPGQPDTKPQPIPPPPGSSPAPAGHWSTAQSAVGSHWPN
jgi:hypothetical protein